MGQLPDPCSGFADALAIRKLPAGERFDIFAAAGTLHLVGRCHPLAIADSTMAIHVVVVGLLQTKLPLPQFVWREMGSGISHGWVPPCCLLEGNWVRALSRAHHRNSKSNRQNHSKRCVHHDIPAISSVRGDGRNLSELGSVSAFRCPVTAWQSAARAIAIDDNEELFRTVQIDEISPYQCLHGHRTLPLPQSIVHSDFRTPTSDFRTLL